jgi:hypothetical protein
MAATRVWLAVCCSRDESSVPFDWIVDLGEPGIMKPPSARVSIYPSKSQVKSPSDVTNHHRHKQGRHIACLNYLIFGTPSRSCSTRQPFDNDRREIIGWR